MWMNNGLPMTGRPAFAPFDVFDRTHSGAEAAWPAYDVVTVDDDHYRIVLAVPGYAEGELEIVSEPNRLTVSGHPKATEPQGQVVRQGIVRPDFRQMWQLADHVRVEAARLENGLLSIELVREVPEALRPRTIPIAGAGQAALSQGEATSH